MLSDKLYFLLGFMLVFNIVYPIFTKNDSFVFADETIEPYIIHTDNITGNYFGNPSYRTVNWTFFKSFFLESFGKLVKYKLNDNWYNGNQYLVIDKTWNDTGFWKLNFIADIPVDIQELNITFYCNKSVYDLIDIDDTEVWFNVSIPDTELFYTVLFNWSDIKDISGLWFTKGKYGDYFYFSIHRGFTPSGHYEFDPTFGYSTSTSNYPISSITGDEYMRAMWDTMGGSPGTADNISIYIASILVTESFQCAIYEYDDYSSDFMGNLVGVTETIEILGSGDNTIYTLNFSDPKPSLSASTNYYLAVRVTTECSGQNTIKGGSSSGYAVFDSDSSPISFDDPYVGETSSSNVPYIICSYTEGSGLDWFIDDQSLNGLIYNLSWFIDDQTLNGIIYNLSWFIDDQDLNGEIFNLSWFIDDQTLNGIIYNLSWFIDDQDLNGEIFNLSWFIDDQTLNGIIYNLSWFIDDQDLNGTIYNSSILSWVIDDQSLNGSIYNISALMWLLDDQSLNGSIYNESWFIDDQNINGSIYNSTGWYIDDQSINGTIYNSTGIPDTVSELYEWIISNIWIKEDDEVEITPNAEFMGIILTLSLFTIFFIIGYRENKRSGGALMLFSGFILLGFEAISSSYLNTLATFLLSPFAIFIIILGIRKWFFMPEGEKTKSEGQ